MLIVSERMHRKVGFFTESTLNVLFARISLAIYREMWYNPIVVGKSVFGKADKGLQNAFWRIFTMANSKKKNGGFIAILVLIVLVAAAIVYVVVDGISARNENKANDQQTPGIENTENGADTDKDANAENGAEDTDTEDGADTTDDANTDADTTDDANTEENTEADADDTSDEDTAG